ncbi:FxDxF family PEP-CTERM protein [Niveibacterium sp. SC-1]|uniref:FxDxF family PEP-CTERM protein n=1 Tax=Niveibacterium sp. SC-1 TaxID=3135646 RepID=UPI00311E8D57
MKLLRKLILPLAFLAAAPASHAVTLGVLSPLVSATAVANVYPTGSFSDFVSFSLTETANVTLGVSSLFAGGATGDWGVYSSQSFASLLYGTYAINSEASISGLGSGTYYVGYQGIVPAPFSKGLVITGGVASPVPEPETYAMLLAGLGMLGMIIRRRSSQF